MKSRIHFCLVLVAVLLVGLLSHAPQAAHQESAPPVTLDDLVEGRLKIVDLTHALNEKNPHWPGDNYKPFRLETIATLEKDGVLSKAFSGPEHCGTHIDAPNHFEDMQPAVDKIAAADLFAPGVVIDVSAAVTRDADFQLEVSHVEAWEQKHGRIPEGAVVLLYTGWSRYWTNPPRYVGRDARDRLRFPGFSAAAAKLLIVERKAKGVGIDTLSIDRGLSRDFEVHHVVNGAGRYGLENVANLDQLPPRGFYLLISPMKIETGTGGPTRIFAVLPTETESD